MMRIEDVKKLPVLRRRRVWSGLLYVLLWGCAVTTVLVSLSIFVVLLSQSWQFFSHVSLVEFLTTTTWTPVYEQPKYGILPLLTATLWVAGIALAFAIPLGIILAVYLSEFAPHRLREMIKPVLELLESIPSIVFGYFALMVLTPLAQLWFPALNTFNLIIPGLVLGIMILPYIVSVSEDAMHAMPQEIREGAYSIGMSRWQTAFKVIVPGAASGIFAGIILAMSRAVGETMVVAIAAGQSPVMVSNPTEGAATITTYIIQMSLGDLPHGGLAYQTIFAAGLALFLLTFLFNVLGALIRKRFKARYE